jgi:uncharacterized membrane protein
MIRVEHQHTIHAPVEVVFEFIAQPQNDAQWQSSCDRVQLKSDGRVGPGTEYRIDFRFLSREMTFEARVEDYRPGESYGYRTLSGPLEYRGQYRFSQVPEGTRLHWVFEAEPGRFFGLIPASLLKKVLTKQVESDLKRLDGLLSQGQLQQSA